MACWNDEGVRDRASNDSARVAASAEPDGGMWVVPSAISLCSKPRVVSQAAIMSVTVGQRSEGCLASARKITLAAAGGKEVLSAVGSGTGWFSCASRRRSRVVVPWPCSPEKGRWPVTISYRTTPRL